MPVLFSQTLDGFRHLFPLVGVPEDLLAVASPRVQPQAAVQHPGIGHVFFDLVCPKVGAGVLAVMEPRDGCHVALVVLPEPPGG